MKRRHFIQSCAALVAAPILPAVLPEPVLPSKFKTRIYDGGLGSVGIRPDMHDIEKMGMVKFDLQGIACLDKMYDVS